MRTAVFAESWWVGKIFEPYDYALGNNNAAARLKTINTILYIYSDSNCLFYYLQSSNIGQLLAIIIFYAFEMKLTFSERKINKKYWDISC